MCTGRLKQRVPSANAIRSAKLPGHLFRFHKRSVDNSAKADAFEIGSAQDVVWGVVFEIEEQEKLALDRAEGLGNGYREKSSTVLDEKGVAYRVALYVADARSIDSTLRPY